MFWGALNPSAVSCAEVVKTLAGGLAEIAEYS
jgi:hypothetical protein